MTTSVKWPLTAIISLCLALTTEDSAVVHGVGVYRWWACLVVSFASVSEEDVRCVEDVTVC